MKKQIVLGLILCSLFTGVTGCATLEDTLKNTFAENDEYEDDAEDDKDDSEDNEDDKDSENEDDDSENSEDNKDSENEDDDSEDSEDDKDSKKDKKSKKANKKPSSPVLGDEDLDSYEGFEYLISDMLITDSEENKSTGKMERKKLNVFIPNDKNMSVSGNKAYSDSLGLNFEIELEPYIRYDEDDYLPSENLEYLIEQEHDPFYNENDKDVVISDIQESDENSYIATVEYCKYNSYDDNYYTIFETYCLFELEDDTTVLIKAEINAEEVTGKTPMLIEELEAFYQFDIDWDKERASQKLETFLAGGGDNTVSTGYFMFTLPDGWKKDKNQSTYDRYVYAPDGNFTKSNCMISFTEEYIGYDDNFDAYNIAAFAKNEENTKELLEENIGAPITNFAVELCDTNIGDTAKISYEFTDGSDQCQGVAYFIIDGGNLYLIESIKIGTLEEDPFLILEDILANGQVRK